MGELKRCDCGAYINRAGLCPNCGHGTYQVDPVTKQRRRCEDALRNATPEVIKKVAQMLGVK